MIYFEDLILKTPEWKELISKVKNIALKYGFKYKGRILNCTRLYLSFESLDKRQVNSFGALRQLEIEQLKLYRQLAIELNSIIGGVEIPDHLASIRVNYVDSDIVYNFYKRELIGMLPKPAPGSGMDHRQDNAARMLQELER